jgi:hypothetical protein
MDDRYELNEMAKFSEAATAGLSGVERDFEAAREKNCKARPANFQ